jgi:hypothetical protein
MATGTYNNPNLYILHILYRAMMIVGTIILSLTTGIYSSTAVQGSLSGYILLFAGVLFLFVEIIMMNFIVKKNNNYFLIISSLIPLFFMMFVVFFLSSIIFNNQTRISEGHLSSEYTSYSRLAVFLLFLQICTMIYASEKDTFKNNTQLDIVSSSVILLLALLTGIDGYIINTIITLYTTDG